MDAIIPLRIDEQNLGYLHIGLSLKHIAQARNDLLWQAGFLALLAVFLTVLSLSMIGRVLTRKFTRLTEASEQIARGEFFFHPLNEGSDDVGRMGAAFNAMAQALEQLRAIWHGHRIAVHITATAPGPGVDTPQDLARVRALLG